MIGVLSTISLAIIQVKQGYKVDRVSIILFDLILSNSSQCRETRKRLLGENDVEAVPQRLGRLTRKEDQTTVTVT